MIDRKKMTTAELMECAQAHSRQIAGTYEDPGWEKVWGQRLIHHVGHLMSTVDRLNRSNEHLCAVASLASNMVADTQRLLDAPGQITGPGKYQLQSSLRTSSAHMIAKAYAADASKLFDDEDEAIAHAKAQLQKLADEAESKAVAARKPRTKADNMRNKIMRGLQKIERKAKRREELRQERANKITQGLARASKGLDQLEQQHADATKEDPEPDNVRPFVKGES